MGTLPFSALVTSDSPLRFRSTVVVTIISISPHAGSPRRAPTFRRSFIRGCLPMSIMAGAGEAGKGKRTGSGPREASPAGRRVGAWERRSVGAFPKRPPRSSSICVNLRNLRRDSLPAFRMDLSADCADFRRFEKGLRSPSAFIRVHRRLNSALVSCRSKKSFICVSHVFHGGSVRLAVANSRSSHQSGRSIIRLTSASHRTYNTSQKLSDF